MGNRRIKEAPGDQDDRRIKKKRHRPFGRCFFSGVKYTSLKHTICVHFKDVYVAILRAKSDIYINLRTAPNTEETKMKKTYTLTDILNTERGRALIDSIEEAEDEIRGRGIDPKDTTEFWVRARAMDVTALKKEFGYDWR